MLNSALHEFQGQLEKTVGVLDAAGRRMSNSTIAAAGLSTQVDKADVAFRKLTDSMQRFAVKELFAGHVTEIIHARREMYAFQGAMDRATVAAKLLSTAMDMSRPLKLMGDTGKAVGEVKSKFDGLAGAVKGAFSSPEASIGNYRKALLDFNRDLFAVSRISGTIGRQGVFNPQFWRDLDRGTTLGRQSFVNLYRTVLENSRGLPMAAREYADFAKVISEKFGGSLDTVREKTERFLSLQNMLPNVKGQMDLFKSMSDTFGKGVDPKGLRETMMLLGDLGADNRALDFFTQYTSSIKGSEQALLNFENAVAKRNQSIENHNVRMGKTLEDTFIGIEKAMTKMTDKMTDVAQGMETVAKSMAVLGAVAPFAMMGGTVFTGMDRFAGMFMKGGGRRLGSALGLPVPPIGAGLAPTTGTVAGRFALGAGLVGGLGTAGYLGYKAIAGESQSNARVAEAEADVKNAEKSANTAEGELAAKKRELEQAKIDRVRGGGAGWTVGGALLGGAIGTLFGPGVGTAIGAAVGAGIGEKFGSWRGGKQADVMQREMTQKNLASDLIDSLELGKSRAEPLKERLQGSKNVNAIGFIGSASELKDEEKISALLTYKLSQNKTINDLEKEDQELNKGKYKLLISQVAELEKQNNKQSESSQKTLEQYRAFKQTEQMMKVVSDRAKQWLDNLQGVSDLLTTFSSKSTTSMLFDQMAESASRYSDAVKQAAEAQVNFLSVSSGPAPTNSQMRELISGMYGVDKADAGVKTLVESMSRLAELRERRSKGENVSSEIEKERAGLNEIVANVEQRSKVDQNILKTNKGIVLAQAEGNQAQLRAMEGDARSNLMRTNAANLVMQINKNLQNATKYNDTNVNLLKQQNELTNIQQQYVENLAVGMAPSFEMRKRVYELTHAERNQQEAGLKAIGEQLKVQVLTATSKKTLVQMGAKESDIQKIINGDMLTAKRILDGANLQADERAEAESAVSAIMSQVMDKNKQIWQLKNQELELTKKIREGFLDVIDEMTTGNDLVSQLMPNAQRGRMAVLDITRMMSGAGFGGAMQVGFASTTMMPGAEVGAAPRYNQFGLSGNCANPTLDRYVRQYPGINDPRESRFMSGVDIWKSNRGAAGVEQAPNMAGFSGDAAKQLEPSSQLLAQSAFNLNQAAARLSNVPGANVPPGVTAQAPVLPGPQYFGGLLSGYYNGSRGRVDMSHGGVFPGTPVPGRDSVMGVAGGRPVALLSPQERWIPGPLTASQGALLTALNGSGMSSCYDGNYVNAMRDASRNPVMDLGRGDGFVLNARANKRFGGMVEQMFGRYNGGTLPTFANGGSSEIDYDIFRRKNQYLERKAEREISSRSIEDANAVFWREGIESGDILPGDPIDYMSYVSKSLLSKFYGIGKNASLNLLVGAKVAAGKTKNLIDLVSGKYGDDIAAGRESKRYKDLVQGPRREIIQQKVAAARKKIAQEVAVRRELDERAEMERKENEERLAREMRDDQEFYARKEEENRNEKIRVRNAKLKPFVDGLDPLTKEKLLQRAHAASKNPQKVQAIYEAEKYREAERREAKLRAQARKLVAGGHDPRDTSDFTTWQFLNSAEKYFSKDEMSRQINSFIDSANLSKSEEDAKRSAVNAKTVSPPPRPAFGMSGLLKGTIKTDYNNALSTAENMVPPITEGLDPISVRMATEERGRRVNEQAQKMAANQGVLSRSEAVALESAIVSGRIKDADAQPKKKKPEEQYHGGMLFGDASVLGVRHDGGFTTGDVSGLHQTASMNSGGMMPTSASLLLGGGINIDRLYLGGKLMGGNLSSGPQSDWHDLQVRNRLS